MEKSYGSLILGCLLAGIVSIGILLLFTSMQEDAPSVPHYDPTSTPTPTSAERIAIAFVDDVPVAVHACFSETCTIAPTPTPTVTPVPTATATATPTDAPATATPKPTKRVATPTPTTAKVVPYPTGYPHTRKVDDPDAHTWKPYARYTMITATGSREYALQQIARTAENGLRVVMDPNGVERYCIALAPQWAGGQSVDIGRCIDIKMANGAVLHCVLGDCKKHEHTQGKKGYYGSQGELIEFIADQAALPDKVRKCGDVSYIGDEFAGAAVSVTVLDLYIKGFGGK